MCARGLPHALRDEARDDLHVQDIARHDERPRRARGQLREAGDGLLRGDVETRNIDAEIFAEIGEGEGERVIGGRARRGADCGGVFLLVLVLGMKAGQGKAGQGRAGQGRAGRGLTVVDDYAGDAEDFLDFREGVDDVVGFGEVAGDVQLAVGALCLLYGARGDGNFVAARGEPSSRHGGRCLGLRRG